MTGDQQEQRLISMVRPGAVAMKEMSVRSVEWDRIRADVQRIRDELPSDLKDSSTWTAAFVGLALAFAIAWLTTLSTKGHSQAVLMTFAFGTILGVVCAVICAFFGSQNRKIKSGMVEKICGDMDEIKGWYDSSGDIDPTPESAAEASRLQLAALRRMLRNYEAVLPPPPQSKHD